MKRNFSNTTPFIFFWIEESGSSSIFGSKERNEKDVRSPLVNYENSYLNASSHFHTFVSSEIIDEETDSDDILPKAKPVNRFKMKVKIKSIKKRLPRILPMDDN